jgi:ABC-type glycerol-3-phosphate transport system substrate-binding protein
VSHKPTTTTGRRLVLPLLLAMALIIAACGGTDDGASADAAGDDATTDDVDVDEVAALDDIDLDGVEIDFWHIQATIYGDAMTQIAADFNESNPYGITVNEIFQGNYDELNQGLRAALAGGGAPAVTMAYESDVLEYLQADVVVPLDKYIAHPEFGLSDEELDDMLDATLERQRLPQYDGQTLSWPHGNSSQGMYVNLSLLEEAGIDAPPTDWDEFIDQARTFTEATGLPYIALGTGLNWQLYNAMRSKGVQPWDGEAGTVDFDNPETVEALEIIRILADEDLAVQVEDTEVEFVNGRAAIEIGTTARVETKAEQIDDFDWTVVITPHDTPEPITVMWGGNQAILDQGDEAKHLAAWLFMRYFAQAEAQATYASMTGYAPAVQSAVEDPRLAANYDDVPQKREVFENVFIHAQIMPPTAAERSIHDVVNDISSEVWLGRTTPEEAAPRLQERAQEVMDDFN